MEKYKYSGLIFFIFFILLQPICAENIDADSGFISIDLQSVPVKDVLHMLAKLSKRNVMISPLIAGNISVHFHHISAKEALQLILTSQKLIQYPENNVWFIVPAEELMRQKEEQQKLQDILTATEPLISKIWQIHYATAKNILHIIQDNNRSLLSKRGFVQIDERTNRLYVYDIAKQISVINDLVNHLDVPVKQVLIETRLASVDSDFERELGILFSIHAKDSSTQNSTGFLDDHTLSSQYGLAVAKLADGSLLDVKLAALQNEGHGELISSPRLLTANQETASIEAGEEIPYQEISRSGATGVAFKKAVLSLKVTPHILPNNSVLLQLQINQDKPSNRIILGVPAIATRQIMTNVLAQNGQTIVLGGIFESNKDNSNEAVPFISEIPFVGWLFKQHSVIQSKRELLIFVTPKIINDTG